MAKAADSTRDVLGAKAMGLTGSAQGSMYTQVDSAEFDEQNVVRTITGKVS